MKLTRTPSGFTLIELLVVISIIAILASLAVPAVTGAMVRGQLVQTLSNARQLQIATQTMTLDTFTSGEGPEWTTSNSQPMSVKNFSDYLTTNNYLTESDLRKIYSAPGRMVQGNNFTKDSIAFKIFAVEETHPSDQPLVVTQNWAASGLTTDNPYGKKGFVYFKKGGEGNFSTRPSDATSTNIFSKGTGDQTNNLSTFLN